MRGHGIAFLLAAWLPTAALAEEPAPRPSPEAPDQVRRQEVVVVSASKVESTLIDAPATVSVVGADTITAAPSQTYGDLLRAVPGVNVVQTSARDVNVSSRQATGTIATSQLALVDGRTIYLDFFGVILWDTVPLAPSEIKQIEVVRGPASSVWGANALSGVVNIISKAPRESQGTELSLNGGSFDRDAGSGAGRGAGYTYGGSLRIARAPSDTWSYKLSAGFLESDAYARPTGQIPVVADPRAPGRTVGGAFYPLDGPGAPGQAFENAGARQPKLDLRVDEELRNGGRISYTAGIAGSAGIIHTGIGPFRIGNDSFFSYGRVAYTRGALKLAGFVNVVDAKAPSLLAVDPLTGEAVRLDFQTQTYDLELGHSRLLGGRHLLSYGGNVRRNNFDISLAPRGQDRTELGAYAQDEFFVGRFRFSAGGRVDKFGNLDKAVFSPRLTAMFKPTPQHSIRASFNKAFRAPSVVNNYLEQAIVTPVDLSALAPFLPPPLQPAVAQPFPLVVVAVGNENLVEESVTAYEIGYTAHFGGTTLGLAGYINDSDENVNFVTLPASQDPYTPANPPPGWVERGLPPALIGLLAQQGVFLPHTAFQYLNLGPLRNKGIEASIEQGFARDWNVGANYSYQADPTVKDSPHPFPVEEIALPPRHRANLALSYAGRRVFASTTLNYVSKALWSDVLTPPYHGFSGAYTMVGATVGTRFDGGRMEVSLRSTNLFNETIQQHVFGDILKRAVSLDLRYRF